MSKKFARSSLCALGMTIMTAQAAEPPKAIGEGEGRLDIIAWPGISSAVRPIKTMTG
jgi:putative spermidine/putrescine transport system substrate-binding protein